jgi:peptide/nickel transport system permease protein
LLLLTVLATSFIVFAVLELDVDTVAVKVLGGYSTQEQRALWLEENGYNRLFITRYAEWLSNFVQGDFGYSTRFKRPVGDFFWNYLGMTAILAGITMAIVVPLALTFGILSGMKETSLLDRVLSFICIISTSVPEFASVILFSFIFVFTLGILPGTSSMIQGFSWKELVLPVLVLVVYDFGYIARITRASMVEVMHTSYVRTAILKGMPFKRVVTVHALRNALIAPVTAIFLQFPWLLSGVVVVEIAFAYKGIGHLLLEGALYHDISLIEMCTVVAVIVVVLTQLIADIICMFLNPRIRFS